MSEQPVVGDIVTFTGSFTQLGIATDPSGTVTINLRDPNGVKSAYTGGQLTHALGTGIYSVDVAVMVAGIWYCKVVAGVGIGQSVDETRLVVSPTRA